MAVIKIRVHVNSQKIAKQKKKSIEHFVFEKLINKALARLTKVKIEMKGV